MLSKLLSAKAVAAVVLGTASVGTAAAAATGTLPDAAQAKAHSIISAVPASDRGDHAGAGAESGGSDSSAKHESTALSGAKGLCQAYGSGQGGENGKRLDGAGFQRLADAAGGRDQIAAYCGKVMAGAKAGGSDATGSPAASQAGSQRDAMSGPCRSWLAAKEAGRTATLGKGVLDRLTAAAGGPDSIASFCTQLVGSVPGGEKPTAAPGKPTNPGGNQGGNGGDDGSAPTHPAPRTPVPATPRG